MAGEVATDNLVLQDPVVKMRRAIAVAPMEGQAETADMQAMQPTDLMVAAAEKSKSALANKNSAC